ncbi:MAG: Gfo/Idh/MocA family oxidoreductase [Planctomycetes bacterium]|nr:Gfo/Idh/MocA family oxidoreductase [Planctomycetota bacterium]
MATGFSRRAFLGRTAALAAAAAGSRIFSAPHLLAHPLPSSLLRIAGIGVGGRGGAHVETSLSEHLVAACDAVDGAVNGCIRRVERHYREQNINRSLPKPFADYRVMLDTMEKEIDAVFVGAPDHHHAPASLRAIERGMHVYCEKPLTHNIQESRQLFLAAREKKVATQMGNGGRADTGWRRLCEFIWADAIGDVQEVHVWTDRPGIPARFWWSQGGGRPEGSDPVPTGVHWDEWLGPAPQRPYLHTYKEGRFQGRPVYQPFVWRGWWDFGTGALGDIGCHAMSGMFSALKIEFAEAVELVKDSGDATDDMFPASSIIRWYVPARAGMPPCQVYWYDGGYYPPRDVGELTGDQQYPDNGTILVGTKGKLTFYGQPQFLPESKGRDFQEPPASIPRCESDHYQEWITACKGGRPPFSNFDHAGPLTEFVLLGNLAIKAGIGKKLEWDGPNMKCSNMPELNQFVSREHRDGWKM